MFKSAVFLASILITSGSFAQDFSAERSKPIPNFVLTTLDGHKMTTKSLRGKIVLFDFWATWCGPCKLASPAMQKIAATFKNKGVVVIGADTFERSPGSEGAKKYKAEHKFSYLFTYNNDAFAQSLGISGIPAFALVDRKGIIRVAQTGLPPGGTAQLVAFFSRRINMLINGQEPLF